MHLFSEILGLAVFCMYCLAGAFYLIHFFRAEFEAGQYKVLLFRATLALHLLYLIFRWVDLGHPPLYNRYAILALVVFCYSLTYLIIESRTGRRELGGFILILAALLFAISLASLGSASEPGPLLRGPIFIFHVLSQVMAYSALFLGFLFASLYLLLHYDIKRHRLGQVYAKLPPLEMLDTMTFHANTMGLVFLSIGIVAGGLWAKQVWNVYFPIDPKMIATAVVWGIYGGYQVLRLLPGWSPKRTAVISIIGFFTLLIFYALMHSMAHSLHNF